MTVEEQHQLVMAHVKKSEPVKWLVARWLSDLGYKVALPPIKLAGSTKEIYDCIDEGDVFIDMRVEVKGLGYDFTCRDDFPFRYGAIVCSCNSFDRAQPKPYGYIHLNKAKTHAAFIFSRDQKQWTTRLVKDSRYDTVEQMVYVSPLELVTFAPFGLKE